MEEKFLSSPQNCMVLLTTSIIGIFVLGTPRLAGQLFLACMERYKIGRKDASFPFTLTYIMRCLSGPLTGYLGRKYGSKRVTEVGCFLCFVGIGGCFFAEDITTVSVLWGGVFGFGAGLGSLLLPHILHDFFDKHYDKAHGFYIASSGIGGFLLPIPTEYLLHSYGTSGTFLVLSGVMLNCFVASYTIGFLKRKSAATTTRQVVVYTVGLDSENTSSGVQNISISSPLKRRSSKNLPSNDLKESSCETATVSSPPTDCHVKVKTEPPKPANIPSLDGTAASDNTMLEVLRIFIDPPFFIFMITQCLFLLVILTMFTIVVDYARDIGVSTDLEVYVLMNLAISDTVGRLVSGFITDGGCMSKVNFYASCFVLMGIFLVALSVVQGFVLFMVALLAIGLTFGGVAMISCGLIISLMEKKDLVIALPCRLFLYPVFGLTKPFLIEYFREKQGSYKGLLLFLTGLCAFGAILSWLLPASKRLRDKRQAK